MNHCLLLSIYLFQKLLVAAKRNLGEILSAFEFLDNNSMDLVKAFRTSLALVYDFFC